MEHPLPKLRAWNHLAHPRVQPLPVALVCAWVWVAAPLNLVWAQATGGAAGVGLESQRSAEADPGHGGESPDVGEQAGQGASASLGQDNASTPQEAVARAKAYFQEGRQMFAERRYREAIRAFELARTLWPVPDLLFNIGRAYEELGDYRTAVGYFQGYLRDEVDPEDGPAVRQRIVDLEERSAQLEAHRSRGERIGAIRLGEEGDTHMEVLLNGRALPQLARGEQVFVPPGEYRLGVRWPDALPFDAQLQVRAGELTSAYPIRRPATPAAALDGKYSPSSLFWVSLGVAGLSYTGAAALGTIAPMRRGDEPGTADRLALGSDLALGAAIIATVGATVVYLAERHGS